MSEYIQDKKLFQDNHGESLSCNSAPYNSFDFIHRLSQWTTRLIVTNQKHNLTTSTGDTIRHEH